jgi:hypothetical protein
MSNKRWLSDISGNKHLHEITLPGSHDAGVYGDTTLRSGGKSNLVRCQTGDIYTQAEHGSRMFDCRVFLKRTGGELQPTMGHFAMEKQGGKTWGTRGETGRLGGYGGSLIACVDDAVKFVKANQREFIILRFSHTYCPNEVAAALTLYKQTHACADAICTTAGNLAQRRIHGLRGKVIMVFADEFHTQFDPAAGYLRFSKYTAGVPAVGGLCTCGIYVSTKDMTKVKSNADQALNDHSKHVIADHLSFVYWQRTGGNVEKSTTSLPKAATRLKGPSDGGTHAQLPAFIQQVRTNMANGTWGRPNIISHDFVKADTCSQIIALNY